MSAMDDVTIEAAERFEDRGEWAKAAAVYRRLASTESDPLAQAGHLCRVGICQLNEGHPEEAEIQLAEAHRLAVDHDADRQLLGAIYLAQSRLAAELGNYRKMLERALESRECYEESAADCTEVDLVLAAAERRRGELQRALDRLKALDVESLRGESRADYLDELGAVRLARGEGAEAVRILREALESDEASGDEYRTSRTRLLLAEANLQMGDRRQAKQLLNQAIESFVDRRSLSDAHALLGRYYEDGHEYQQAVRSYRRALELDYASEDPVGQTRVLRSLGRVYRKKGDPEQARDFFAQAAGLLQSSEDDVERAALLTEEGLLLMVDDSPDYMQAASRFRQAMNIASEDGDERAVAIAQRNLARALREAGDVDEALHMLEEARVVLEERGDLQELDDLLDDLGEAYLENGAYTEALEVLEESIRLDEKLEARASLARSRMLIGRVYAVTGERSRAKREFDAAKEIYDEAADEVGQSDAYHKLGEWFAEEGRLRDAIRLFRRGLAIDQRHDDTLGVVRANRSLASAYRKLGDLVRAEELLDDAIEAFGRISDAPERAALRLEAAQLALAHRDFTDARSNLEQAVKEYARLNSTLDEARCHRVLGGIFAAEGNYKRAIELLEQAEQVFSQRRNKPELDDLYDDLGEVHLAAGNLPEARTAVEKSLDLGREMGWNTGRGRSLILLGRVAMAEGGPTQLANARHHFMEAIDAFENSQDQVGESAARIELGSWYLADGNDDKAIKELKEARSLYQQHGDLRGLARCNQELAHVYIARNEILRAEEALEQAEEQSLHARDPQQSARLRLEIAELCGRRGDHDEAVTRCRDALRDLRRFGKSDETNRAYRLLIRSLHSLGRTAEAVQYMRELGQERAELWQGLLTDLEPSITEAVEDPYRVGHFRRSVSEAFSACEKALRAQVTDDEGEERTTAEVLEACAIATNQTGTKITALALAAFDLYRDHPPVDEPDPVEAFAAICVANLILTTLSTTTETIARPPS